MDARMCIFLYFISLLFYKHVFANNLLEYGIGLKI